MKNKVLIITAIVAVIGFAFIACDNGSGGNNNNNNNNNNGDDDPVSTPINLGTGSVFNISGTFNNISFKLINAPASSRSARAVTSDTYAVTGVLKDGDTNIWVSGTYDPTDQTYSVSTSAGTLGKRYSITGAFDSSGDSAGSTATMLTKGSGNWATGATYSVNEETTVDITGNAFEAESGGIPAIIRGNWYFEGEDQWENNCRAQSFINQWNMVSYVALGTGILEYTTTTATIIEVEDKGNGKYNVILAYPLYAPANGNAGEAQVVAAITDFFSGKGVTPVKVEQWMSDPDNPYYYIKTFNDNFVVVWGNFDEWGLVNQFYSTNHLDKYLVSQNVTPAMRYESRQFQFNSATTELKMMRFVTGVAHVFSTLQQAKSASYLDEINDVLPFSR